MFRVLSVSILLSLSGCSTLWGRSDNPLNPNAKGQLNLGPSSLTGEDVIPNVPVIKTNESQTTVIPAKRASRLPAVNLVQNKEVVKELSEMKSKPRTVARALEQRDPHLPKLEQIFADEGLPSDLTNVAMIESGFNEHAKSPMGAIGMWQMMKSTAKYYGLKINFKEDERKDVILSTLAAARHLRDLYNRYNDWYLALAAYNMGVGGLERVMQKAGTRDFWELSRKGYLPKETARFVPKILAAAIIAKDPETHGFAG
jgi:membrane-bound lytic murein transglycosylase D